MKNQTGSTLKSRVARLMSGFLVLFLVAGVVSAASYKRKKPITMNLTAPSAVAFDAQNNLYVVESTTNQLHVYSPSGAHLKSFSGLSKPMSVAVDARGRIIVANADRGNVEIYSNNFVLITKVGTGDGEFAAPNAVAIDQAGSIYVADSRIDRIKVYNSDGSFRVSFGAPGSEAGQFHFPTSIAIDNLHREVYVTDLPQIQTRNGMTEAARIQVFTLQGLFKRSFGTYGQGDGMLTRPMGVAVASGKVFVTDSYQNVVEVFTTKGTFLTSLFDPANPMRNPLGIAATDQGTVFIASINSGKIEVYSMHQ